MSGTKPSFWKQITVHGASCNVVCFQKLGLVQLNIDPLDRVANFKLTVLSHQKEFLVGPVVLESYVSPLSLSTYSLLVRTILVLANLRKVLRESRKSSNCGSGIHNLKDFEILSPESMKLWEFMTFTLKRWLFLERTLQLRLLTNFQAK